MNNIEDLTKVLNNLPSSVAKYSITELAASFRKIQDDDRLSRITINDDSIKHLKPEFKKYMAWKFDRKMSNVPGIGDINKAFVKALMICHYHPKQEQKISSRDIELYEELSKQCENLRVQFKTNPTDDIKKELDTKEKLFSHLKEKVDISKNKHHVFTDIQIQAITKRIYEYMTKSNDHAINMFNEFEYFSKKKFDYIKESYGGDYKLKNTGKDRRFKADQENNEWLIGKSKSNTNSNIERNTETDNDNENDDYNDKSNIVKSNNTDDYDDSWNDGDIKNKITTITGTIASNNINLINNKPKGKYVPPVLTGDFVHVEEPKKKVYVPPVLSEDFVSVNIEEPKKKVYVPPVLIETTKQFRPNNNRQNYVEYSENREYNKYNKSKDENYVSIYNIKESVTLDLDSTELFPTLGNSKPIKNNIVNKQPENILIIQNNDTSSDDDIDVWDDKPVIEIKTEIKTEIKSKQDSKNEVKGESKTELPKGYVILGKSVDMNKLGGILEKIGQQYLINSNENNDDDLEYDKLCQSCNECYEYIDDEVEEYDYENESVNTNLIVPISGDIVDIIDTEEGWN